MYNADTDLLFPPRVIPELSDLRGKTWKALVERVLTTDETSVEKLAFILLMVRLSGCAVCNGNAHRALHGCTQCSKQTLRRFHGSDEDLNQLFITALHEVELYLQKETGQ
jgi:hypothetical protein